MSTAFKFETTCPADVDVLGMIRKWSQKLTPTIAKRVRVTLDDAAAKIDEYNAKIGAVRSNIWLRIRKKYPAVHEVEYYKSDDDDAARAVCWYFIDKREALDFMEDCYYTRRFKETCDVACETKTRMINDALSGKLVIDEE